MADNITFNAATYSTVAMMPVKDEEVHAAWGRQLMENSVQSIGEWATVVLEETGNVFMGSKFTNWSALPFFAHQPFIEVFHMRGGTQLHKPAFVAPDPRITTLFLGVEVHFGERGAPFTGSGLHIAYFPDDRKFGTHGTFTGSQAQYGTFIYRLRGS